jgi:hypothetical protein
MATSGSVNFSTSRDEVIKYALLNVGGIASGGTPTATQYTDCAYLLNGIVKMWQTEGMPLWALKSGYIFPIHDTNQVLLGASGGKAASAYTHTTIGADEASGQTAITVSSITGISDTDNIGVEQDDGTIHWTTVSGSPSGTTVTLASALTDEASSGNHIYAYATTAQIHRPLRIIHAYTYDNENNTSIPMRLVSSTDHFDLGSPEIESYPLQYAYSPQLTNGIFRFYPRFQNGTKHIAIYFQRPFEDFDATGDEPDFPQEWYLPLVWMLSWAIGPSYGMPIDERRIWLSEANMMKEQLLSFGMEEGSVRFEPWTEWTSQWS